MVVYDKELERTLRARKTAFEMAATQAGHDWHEVDLSDAFAHWIGRDAYKDAYFESPDDLRLKIDAEFPSFVADRIVRTLKDPATSEKSIVAVFGVGTLFGFARVSQILQLVERDIRGRLMVFFPGQLEGNNYRLLDARDGWNYLAVAISLRGEEESI